MSKFAFITALMYFPMMALNAQRAYTISFADTDDAIIGEINLRDLSYFNPIADSAASSLKYETTSERTRLL